MSFSTSNITSSDILAARPHFVRLTASEDFPTLSDMDPPPVIASVSGPSQPHNTIARSPPVLDTVCPHRLYGGLLIAASSFSISFRRQLKYHNYYNSTITHSVERMANKYNTWRHHARLSLEETQPSSLALHLKIKGTLLSSAGL